MSAAVQRLSYSQLFSFQVAHNFAGANIAAQPCNFDANITKAIVKSCQWRTSILEIDFTMGMVFLQDKDKIISAQPFTEFKKFVVSRENAAADNLISLRFNQQQWQVLTQNSTEKACVTHLLSAAAMDQSPEEAIASAAPTLIGLDRAVWRAGIMVQKARRTYRQGARYLALVPGKLFLFKTPELVGQHVRYVTSLVRASIRILRGLEFELLVPGTKSVAFLAVNEEEMKGWMGALQWSIDFVADILRGQNPSPPDLRLLAEKSEGLPWFGNPQLSKNDNAPTGPALHTSNADAPGTHQEGGMAEQFALQQRPAVETYADRESSKGRRASRGRATGSYLAQSQRHSRDPSNIFSRGQTPSVLASGNKSHPSFYGEHSQQPSFVGEISRPSVRGASEESQPPFVGGNFPAYNLEPQGFLTKIQQAGPSYHEPQQTNRQTDHGNLSCQSYPNAFVDHRNTRQYQDAQSQAQRTSNCVFNHMPAASYDTSTAKSVRTPQFGKMPGAYNDYRSMANRGCSAINNDTLQNSALADGQFTCDSQAATPLQHPSLQIGPDTAKPHPTPATGVIILQRAAQALREFNNDMDQYLSPLNPPSGSQRAQTQMGRSDRGQLNDRDDHQLKPQFH